jgi:hypothetical protein
MKALVALVLLAGCSYQSQYTPALDGRARPRWAGNHVSNNIEALPPGCVDEIAWLIHPELRAERQLAVAPIVYAAVWVHHPLPPLPAPHLPPPIGWRPVRSLVSGGGGRDLSEGTWRVAAVVLAVIAAPITALTLATVRPELDDRVGAIDQVNAYNDLARSAGTQCSAWRAP